MDQLKRWREERAARRSRKILAGLADPVPPRAPVPTRRERLAARRSRSGHWRLWPDPPPVSPVHPQWDDPTGGILKRGLYSSMAVHCVLVPALFLLAGIHWATPRFFPSTGDRTLSMINVAGGGGRTRAQTPPAIQPKPPPPKPAQEKKPDPPKEKTPKPQPKVEPRPQDKPGGTPVPVPDDKLKNRHAPAPNDDAPARTPATEPLADEGPLVAGSGPVSGSEASIGDVDGVYFPYGYYLNQIRQKIADAWRVPEGVALQGRRIQAVVRFRIMGDGSLREIVVEEPSGNTVYDREAQRAVSLVHLPPLPQEFPGEFLVVHFQFSYVGR